MPIINSVISAGGGSAPTLYREFQLDANGVLQPNTTTTHIMDFTGVKDISIYAFSYAYQDNTAITGTVDMSDLTTFSNQYACQYMFQGCTGITGINLSSLTIIDRVATGVAQYMFKGCTSLTSIDLSSLTEINSNNAMQAMFQGCTSLSTLYLPSLTKISGSSSCSSTFAGCTGLTNIKMPSLTTLGGGYSGSAMFQGCTGLTSVEFPSLSTLIYGRNCQYMFQVCTNLTKLSFYALDTNSFGNYTSDFNGMLSGVTGCTVHFPMRIQSTIGSWSDVTNGFGGTNTTVLFDIVTSLTGADTNTYTRQQKDSTSTATAWTYNSTLYYTSGTTEPAVGDTIYSDASCTTAVTTVSAIA